MSESNLAGSMRNWVARNKVETTCLVDIALAASEGDVTATDALELVASSENIDTRLFEMPCIKGLGKCGIRLESAQEGARIIPIDCPTHTQPL